MNEKELAGIAAMYLDKGYSSEDLRYGDDLYDATDEDKDLCVELYHELKEIGMGNFIVKYKV